MLWNPAVSGLQEQLLSEMSAQALEFRGSKEKAGISLASLTMQIHAYEEETANVKRVLLNSFPMTSSLNLTEQVRQLLSELALTKDRNANLIQVSCQHI